VSESPPTPDADLVVRATGLVKAYGDLTAVDNLDLEVRRGECLGLLGPNGAGKTTTIKILSTLVAPSEGEVRVLGLDPVREGPRVRRQLGVVPQDVALYGDLTAAENLAFFGRMYGVAPARLAQRVAWGLEVAGLTERADTRVSTYSGGMKRRLNIVAALLHEPELVFLDEPTVGIDPQSRNHVFEMVEELHAGGLTLVYTTHQLGEVERLCDRILVMDRGRQVAMGTLEQLQREVSGSGAAGLDLPPGTDLEQVAAVLRAQGIEAAVRVQAPDLEEVFLAVTGRALRDD
jgi:linearmycin/streptolysin S transport system ATP-binding protein